MGENTARHEALERFREAGGVLRTSQAQRLGVHPRTLYRLRDAGEIEQLSRGVYRLSEMPLPSEPDLVAVAARVHKAVVCLISALHVHGLTTEIPHEVSIALPPGTKRPEIDYPPVRVFWFSGDSYTTGVETWQMDGIQVKIYGAAKTVADCFKFRNKVGIDVAVEALRTGLEGDRLRPAEVLEHARVCRVERVIMPYLEAML
jgi:predicted transcriptional regulator of viral defense system